MKEKPTPFASKLAQEARISLDIVLNGREGGEVAISERGICPYTQRIEEYLDGDLNPITHALTSLHLKRCASCRDLVDYIDPSYDAGFALARLKGTNVLIPSFAAAGTLGDGDGPTPSTAAVLLREDGAIHDVEIIKTRLADAIHWWVQLKAKAPGAQHFSIALAKSENGQNGPAFHNAQGCALDIILVDGLYVLTLSNGKDSTHLVLELA